MDSLQSYGTAEVSKFTKCIYLQALWGQYSCLNKGQTLLDKPFTAASQSLHKIYLFFFNSREA